MSDDQPTVGFVGLGAMGWPMAHNLHAAGFPLVVRDVSPHTEDRFAAEHDTTMKATTPNDFRSVGILVTMLPDGGVVQDAVIGWGIAAAASPGTILLDMSSSDPTDTLALASRVESLRMKVVDAPVSGGVARAVTGELAVMVGGAPDDVAAVQPVLRVLGDPARQFRTGGLGTGHAMKALNNVIAATTSCVMAEALAAGQRFGLDPATMIDVINASTGRSFVSELNYGTEVLTGRYGSGFRLGLMAKDTRIAASIAAAAGIDAPVIALASERWAAAVTELGPAVDQSRAHQAWTDAKFSRGLWQYRARQPHTGAPRMTEQDEQSALDEQARHESWIEIGIRTDIPHPARVYNYLLGGKDHFAADRDAAEMSLSLMPEIRDSAKANRRFMGRTIRFLSAEAGIRQFLDIGTGLPASPNTHEMAAPGSRVVYVDNDPVVFMRAKALMADNKSVVSIAADMREVDGVLSAAGKLLDFSQPVGLLFVASLHNIPDADDPAGIVARYLAALAPGSHVAISHVTGDFTPAQMAEVTASYAARGTTFIGRTLEQVTRMFNGRELLSPGVVQISHWRPDDADPDPNPDRVWGYAGVARV